MGTAKSKVQALIVYAHPEPTSFCAALKNAAIEALDRHDVSVEVSDLYAEGFNPVGGRHDFLEVANPERFHYQTEQLAASRAKTFANDISREQTRVAKADLIVFVFPLWWGGVPAILKGWFDRVLAYGFAYADGKRYEHGYFKHKRGILAISTGGTAQRFSEDGSYGSISRVLHGVQHCMLRYMGLETPDPFVGYASPRVTEDEREQYLRDWQERLTALVADPVWMQRLETHAENTGADPIAAETDGRWANMN